MAPPLTFYFEDAGSISQGTAGFSLRDGKASSLLYLLGSSYGGAGGQVLLSDVTASAAQILGSVSTSVGSGALNRTLPLAHPLYPWLYASNVNIRGLGQGYKVVSSNQLEAPPFPGFTAYPNYEFNVEFTNRPYVLAANGSVPTLPVSFANTSQAQKNVNIAAEWVRYTNWWYDRKFESITARQGFMKFRTNGVASINGVSVDGVQYADMPKLFMPDSVLHIVWHQVPYRYVYSNNSYIDGLIGFINQNAFTTWAAGELLYIGYVAKPYTPPVQELDNIFTGTSGFIFSSEKWVDVEFLFLRTTRGLTTNGELYNNPGAGQVGRPNWIQSGWNLLPNVADRQFHYVSTAGVSPDTDKTKWAPLFQSTEFALLFTDPDAPGAYQLPA